MENKNIENINARRIEIMIARRLKNRDMIRESAEIQDNLSRKSGSWSGEEEIIKWRKEQKF